MAVNIDYSKTYYIRNASTKKYLTALKELNKPVIMTEKEEDGLHQWRFVQAGPDFHYLQCPATRLILGINGVYQESNASYFRLDTRAVPTTMRIFFAEDSSDPTRIGMSINGTMEYDHKFSGEARIRGYDSNKIGALMDDNPCSASTAGQKDTFFWILEPGLPVSNVPRPGTQVSVRPNKVLPSLGEAQSYYIRNVYTGNYLTVTYNPGSPSFFGWIFSFLRGVENNEIFYQWKITPSSATVGQYHIQNVGSGKYYTTDGAFQKFYRTGVFLRVRTKTKTPEMPPSKVTIALDLDDYCLIRALTIDNGINQSFYLHDQGTAYATSTSFAKGEFSQWARNQWVLELVPGSTSSISGASTGNLLIGRNINDGNLNVGTGGVASSGGHGGQTVGAEGGKGPDSHEQNISSGEEDTTVGGASDVTEHTPGGEHKPTGGIGGQSPAGGSHYTSGGEYFTGRDTEGHSRDNNTWDNGRRPSGDTGTSDAENTTVGRGSSDEVGHTYDANNGWNTSADGNKGNNTTVASNTDHRGFKIRNLSKSNVRVFVSAYSGGDDSWFDAPVDFSDPAKCQWGRSGWELVAFCDTVSQGRRGWYLNTAGGCLNVTFNGFDKELTISRFN